MVVKGKNAKKVGGQRRPSEDVEKKKQPAEKRVKKEEEEEEKETKDVEVEKETTEETESATEPATEPATETKDEGMGKEEVKEAAAAEAKVGAEGSGLTTQTFDTFEGLSEPTKQGIRDMGFTHLTRIQAASLPPLMRETAGTRCSRASPQTTTTP